MDRVSSLIRKHSGVVITPSIEEAVNNLGSTQRREEVIRREGIECYKQGVCGETRMNVTSSHQVTQPSPAAVRQTGVKKETRARRGEAGEWVSSFTTDAGGWDARTLRVFDLPLLPVSTVSIHPQVPLVIKEDVFRV